MRKRRDKFETIRDVLINSRSEILPTNLSSKCSLRYPLYQRYEEKLLKLNCLEKLKYSGKENLVNYSIKRTTKGIEMLRMILHYMNVFNSFYGDIENDCAINQILQWRQDIQNDDI